MNTRRRMFLRGLSGAALSIPFLPSLAREARGAGPAPKRFLMLLSHSGRHPDYWYPTMEPTTQVAPGVRSLRLADVPQSLSKTLAPFDDLRAKTTILRGFDVLGDSGW